MEDTTSLGMLPEPIKSVITKLKDALTGKALVLYYPVYLNTFALAHVFEQYDIGRKPKFFNWPDIVPSDLLQSFKSKPEIIYCFSSSDKEADFRKEVERLITENRLDYAISQPANTFDESESLDINADIEYSNFSLKYLFFQNKVNIEYIHEFGKKFFKIDEIYGNPYMTKLLSILIARGYQTIHIDTDIKDESKGLLRKLLHEEFGFKFRLTPNLPEYKANNTLVVETKGGQQSFEEIKRQAPSFKPNPSQLKTFVVPDKKKYTSKTKLIAIYRTEYFDKPGEQLNRITIRRSINEIAKLIFKNPEMLFKVGSSSVHEDFIVKNIHFISESIRLPEDAYTDEKFEIVKQSNSFLQSLELYKIAEKVVKEEFRNIIKHKADELICSASNLCKIVIDDANFLQIDSVDNFIKCLKDHHVGSDGPPLYFSKEFEDDYKIFSKKLVSQYSSTKDREKKDIIINGMFLLKLIIQNPNGKIIDSDDRKEKFIKDSIKDKSDFKKGIEEAADTMDKDTFNSYYNYLRIIAEDLNFLIVEETLLCDPKIVFRILDEFDLSEFEYLYSIDFAKRYYS